MNAATAVGRESRPKRIVLCADGTWNEAEKQSRETGRPQPTNVLKAARAIKPRAADGVPQVVYYIFGVGTSGGLDEFTGGAFGDGLERNVRSLYRFLVYNYEPGDEVYLFGFSRGAFTVRTLAGFMKKVGLVQKEDEYYTGELYQLYESSIAQDSPEWAHAFRHIEDRRPAPPIRCIGVWDTVGALGAPGFLGQVFNRNRYKYHDIELNNSIQHAFHALAIDEHRKPFAPSIWKRPPGWLGVLEQVWFPGVHSNVGGGYSPDGLANEALHWMVEKAQGLGLDFDERYLVHYEACFNSVLKDSMSPMYRMMGPITRAIGAHLADGEAVHQSALDRMNLPACDYHPDNLAAFLAQHPNPPIATTTRVARGVPCTEAAIEKAEVARAS